MAKDRQQPDPSSEPPHESAADREAFARIDRLWHDSAAPEPSPERWRATLDRIAAALPARPPRTAAGRWPWLGLSGAAAAAAVAAIVGVWWLTPPPKVVPPPAEEPFAVADDDDVRVTSIDPAELSAVVVGLRPSLWPMEFAAHNDVVVHNVTPPAIAGALPEVRGQDGPGPMIWPGIADEREP